MPAAFKHLVVDTNALISGATLPGLAENYWTVEAGLAEVRDARSRAVLEALPFELKTKIPAESSIAAVRDFAKKTGDLGKLSKIDIEFLALTHQLDKECNGETFLRREPPKAVTSLGKPSSASSHFKADAAVSGEVAAEKEQEGEATGAADGSAAEAKPVPRCRFFKSKGGCRSGEACKFRHEEGEDFEERGKAEVGSGSKAVAEKPAPSGSDVSPSDVAFSSSTSVRREPPSEGVDDDVDDDDSDTGAWICPAAPAKRVAGAASFGPLRTTTSSSVAAAVEAGALPFGKEIIAGVGMNTASSDVDEGRVPVGVITSDFPMQNTALQMGLKLVSVGGKAITTVKSWVMKCDACFTIDEDTTRMFCKRCGNATLARLGVTLGADGAPRYHYKKNRTFNNKGTVYSIPAPKGGRDAVDKDVVLREDQLLMGGWAVKMRTHGAKASGGGVEKRETLYAGKLATLPGIAADFSSSSTSSHAPGGFRIGKEDAEAAGIVVGFGRKNPNAWKGKR